MRADSIGVRHPRGQDLAKMRLMERDQPVQTFPAYRPDQPFAEGIGLRRPYGRLEHAQPHRSNRAVDRRGVDRIAVVNEEAMPGLARDAGPTLSDRPVRRWMLGHIPMHVPSRADVEQDEDIQDTERSVIVVKKSDARTT